MMDQVNTAMNDFNELRMRIKRAREAAKVNNEYIQEFAPTRLVDSERMQMLPVALTMDDERVQELATPPSEDDDWLPDLEPIAPAAAAATVATAIAAADDDDMLNKMMDKNDIENDNFEIIVGNVPLILVPEDVQVIFSRFGPCDLRNSGVDTENSCRWVILNFFTQEERNIAVYKGNVMKVQGNKIWASTQFPPELKSEKCQPQNVDVATTPPPENSGQEIRRPQGYSFMVPKTKEDENEVGVNKTKEDEVDVKKETDDHRHHHRHQESKPGFWSGPPTFALFAFLAVVVLAGPKWRDLAKLKQVQDQLAREMRLNKILVDKGMTWSYAENGIIPPGSLQVGSTEDDGNGQIFVARAWLKGELRVGKLVADENGGGAFAFFSNNGREVRVTSYETLVIPPKDVEWVPVGMYEWYEYDEIVGGVSWRGKKFLIGRALFQNEWVVGTVRWSGDVPKLFFPWGNKECTILKDFDILVRANAQ